MFLAEAIEKLWSLTNLLLYKYIILYTMYFYKNVLNCLIFNFFFFYIKILYRQKTIMIIKLFITCKLLTTLLILKIIKTNIFRDAKTKYILYSINKYTRIPNINYIQYFNDIKIQCIIIYYILKLKKSKNFKV